MRDFSNLDEAFLRFYQKHIDQPVTLDDESSAITRLIPEGKSDQVFYTLAVFKKTDVCHVTSGVAVTACMAQRLNIIVNSKTRD